MSSNEPGCLQMLLGLAGLIMVVVGVVLTFTGVGSVIGLPVTAIGVLGLLCMKESKL